MSDEATRVTWSRFLDGSGLLNLAEAPWAHAVGLVCLFAFLVLAFVAIVLPTQRFS